VIVNQSFANDMLGGHNPIGRRIRRAHDDQPLRTRIVRVADSAVRVGQILLLVASSGYTASESDVPTLRTTAYRYTPKRLLERAGKNRLA
jgi:hypothetical protein